MASEAGSTEPETVSKDLFKAVMRHVTSPVAIIATAIGDRRGGLTATSVCSATAEPPTLLVCINGTAAAGDMIAQAGIFSVNFLADDQADLARLFSTPGLDPGVRFTAATWTRAETGAPLLIGAVSAFDCRLVDIVPCGGHRIFFGRVVAAQSRDDHPLLYRDGYFRRIAVE